MSADQKLKANFIFVSPKLWIAGAAAAALCVILVLHSQPRPSDGLEAFDVRSAALTPSQPEARASRCADSAAAAPSSVVAVAKSLPMVMKKARVRADVAGDGPGAAEAPMIARTVSLAFTVQDLTATRSALDALLFRVQGYPAQLSAGSPENGARTLSASVRIPAPALALTLNELKKLGRTTNESQGGEEVTSQHEDLVARLKTARETEERYRAILVKRTGKVADVLEVEEQIANVRGNIEQMEAEQAALRHRVSFASVDVQFTEEYKARLDGPFISVRTQMSNALIAGLRHVGDSMLGILLFAEEYGPTFVFWILLLGTPVVFMLRRRIARVAATSVDVRAQ